MPSVCGLPSEWLAFGERMHGYPRVKEARGDPRPHRTREER